MKRYVICLLALLWLTTARAEVRLPRLISDGMVLQREAKVNIWGWANVGEQITVSFVGKNYRTTADAQGRWSLRLSALAAGGPFRMEIQAANHIVIDNIMIGDVWVCSGQSNMVLPMERVKERYAEEISHCNYPAIRHFSQAMKYDFHAPQKDVASGRWEAASPDNILRFSATAYFFAKTVYEKYRIPIGLINASVGGTPVESWLSAEAVHAFPATLDTLRKYQNDQFVKQILDQDKARSDAWYRLLRQRDGGFAQNDKTWLAADFDASTWPTMLLPGFWADTGVGPVNGVVWFRKEIQLPDSLAGKSARLLMGRIVDSDSVYVNGVLVGTTGYQYPPRRYTIPEKILKQGKNILVVRVINNSGRGGFIADKPYQLLIGDQTIDLRGAWQYQLGAIMAPLASQTFIQYKPTGLFNAMIHPLIEYNIKGVLWYQGEANTGNPQAYRQLLPALIADWRKKWQQGAFPFLYVQLPNFMQARPQPSESKWAELRDAQLQTLRVKNTAMVVTIDIGEWNDIHPLNKKDVGERLALAAEKIAYGEKQLVHSGPIYQSMKIKGNKIVLTFAHTGSGLVAKNSSELHGFAVAGPDMQFIWAKAKIDGNTVVVWHEQIGQPVAVRYAWADNPENANLYNAEGLPASPFSTR